MFSFRLPSTVALCCTKIAPIRQSHIGEQEIQAYELRYLRHQHPCQTPIRHWMNLRFQAAVDDPNPSFAFPESGRSLVAGWALHLSDTAALCTAHTRSCHSGFETDVSHLAGMT